MVTSNKDKTAQLLFNECVSKKLYERQLDAMLTAIGEDPMRYSVHYLIARGATELFLAGTSSALDQNYCRVEHLSTLGTPVGSLPTLRHGHLTSLTLRVDTLTRMLNENLGRPEAL